MKHELKTWPIHFQAVETGRKTFEVRNNDRGFKVGDTLILREYSPTYEYFTGARCERTVTHILAGGQFGIEPGYVVMSLSEVS